LTKNEIKQTRKWPDTAASVLWHVYSIVFGKCFQITA